MLTPEQFQELEQMQGMIDAYNVARSETNQFINSLPPEQQQQALNLVMQFRDPQTEAAAVQGLRDLLATIYGREATAQELRQGLRINQGMSGVYSTAVTGAVLLGGLVALAGLYASLFGAEGALRQSLGLSPSQMEEGETPSTKIKDKLFGAGKWLALMAATGYGSYYMFDRLAK